MATGAVGTLDLLRATALSLSRQKLQEEVTMRSVYRWEKGFGSSPDLMLSGTESALFKQGWENLFFFQLKRAMFASSKLGGQTKCGVRDRYSSAAAVTLLLCSRPHSSLAGTLFLQSFTNPYTQEALWLFILARQKHVRA